METGQKRHWTTVDPSDMRGLATARLHFVVELPRSSGEGHRIAGLIEPSRFLLTGRFCPDSIRLLLTDRLNCRSGHYLPGNGPNKSGQFPSDGRIHLHRQFAGIA